MKAKHHLWSSLAAGGALYWATGSSASLAGSMVGGFLIDADHIIDQLCPSGMLLRSGESAPLKTSEPRLVQCSWPT